MLISLLIILLLSNAVTLRRDKSILFSRLFLIGLISTSILALNNLFIKPLEKGIGIYGGLFNISTYTQTFNIFIFLISAIILTLSALILTNVINTNSCFRANITFLVFCVSINPIFPALIVTVFKVLFSIKYADLDSLFSELNLYMDNPQPVSGNSTAVNNPVPTQAVQPWGHGYQAITDNIGDPNSFTSFSRRLSSLTYDINARLRVLSNSNFTFEQCFEKANHYRSIGDTANQTHYTDLARTERLTIQQNLASIENNIEQKNKLSIQGKELYPRSQLHRFGKALSADDQNTLNISTTLSKENVWDL